MNRFRTGSTCVVAAMLPAFLAAAVPSAVPQGDPEVINADAYLEIVHAGAFFTEGPAAALDGSIYFSDITFTAGAAWPAEAGHILRYDPTSGRTAVYRSPSGMSNGLKFDAQGRLVACEGADHGARRVTRTDLTTGKTVILATHYNGDRLNAPNDLSLDEKGRIYFSDPKYLGHEPMEQEVFGVYRIDPDGTLTRIIMDAGKPNGIAVSPDQKTLYVVSHDNGSHASDRLSSAQAQRLVKGRMALLAYDLSPAGQATFRETLVDYTPQNGPDGLVCDEEGNIYVAVRDVTRMGIYVYSPDGKERAYIPTPALPTNVAFGRGAQARTLYITYGDNTTKGGAVLARIQVEKRGYQLPSE